MSQISPYAECRYVESRGAQENSYKTFFSIHNFTKQAGVFDLGKRFTPCLTFQKKGRSLPELSTQSGIHNTFFSL